MAPALASSASARLVLPAPDCPTRAIVLIRLIECATGLLLPGIYSSTPGDGEGPRPSGLLVAGVVRLAGRGGGGVLLVVLAARVAGGTLAAPASQVDAAGHGQAASDQPFCFDAGEHAVKGVEHAAIEGDGLVLALALQGKGLREGA